MPRPAQGAHKGHPYGDVGGWWDAGGNYGAGLRPLRRDVDGGIANVVRSRGDGAWIPAFAGMTKWGRGNDEFRLWPGGGGLPNPAQGAHKGRPYGDVWDAGGLVGRRIRVTV